MRIYNTPDHQIEEVSAQSPPEVKIYTCGPTVYDYAHIGHWFNYVRMDTLVRTLKLAGLNPKWIMNITDVGHLTSDADEGEDKLEAGARREGKTAWEVAQFYTEDFLNGLKQLSITWPTKLVKATEHIKEQIDLIKVLESKGYTYIISDGVYYDTSKFKDYARLASLDLDEQKAGARVSINPEKKQPWDFALWKFSPRDRQRDMEWDSPWGKGFPGWHIECSAMSLKYLGPTLDIHTGGIDHVPVHHTNEIAQSEAATGQKFANFWFHSNHVLIDDQKISKSLGNGIRLQEVADKGIAMAALRLHILESHYRSQSHFSWESLSSAASRLNHWLSVSELSHQLLADQASGQQKTLGEQLDSAVADIKKWLFDDLKAAESLAVIDSVLTLVETSLLSKASASHFYDLLKLIDESLGINLTTTDIETEQKELIQRREGARQRSDWVKADQLRQQLADQSIGLRDTKLGAVWFRERPLQSAH